MSSSFRSPHTHPASLVDPSSTIMQPRTNVNNNNIARFSLNDDQQFDANAAGTPSKASSLIASSTVIVSPHRDRVVDRSIFRAAGLIQRSTSAPPQLLNDALSVDGAAMPNISNDLNRLMSGNAGAGARQAAPLQLELAEAEPGSNIADGPPSSTSSSSSSHYVPFNVTSWPIVHLGETIQSNDQRLTLDYWSYYYSHKPLDPRLKTPLRNWSQHHARQSITFPQHQQQGQNSLPPSTNATPMLRPRGESNSADIRLRMLQVLDSPALHGQSGNAAAVMPRMLSNDELNRLVAMGATDRDDSSTSDATSVSTLSSSSLTLSSSSSSPGAVDSLLTPSPSDDGAIGIEHHRLNRGSAEGATTIQQLMSANDKGMNQQQQNHRYNNQQYHQQQSYPPSPALGPSHYPPQHHYIPNHAGNNNSVFNNGGPHNYNKSMNNFNPSVPPSPQFNPYNVPLMGGSTQIGRDAYAFQLEIARRTEFPTPFMQQLIAINSHIPQPYTVHTLPPNAAQVQGQQGQSPPYTNRPPMPHNQQGGNDNNAGQQQQNHQQQQFNGYPQQQQQFNGYNNQMNGMQHQQRNNGMNNHMNNNNPQQQQYMQSPSPYPSDPRGQLSRHDNGRGHNRRSNQSNQQQPNQQLMHLQAPNNHQQHHNNQMDGHQQSSHSHPSSTSILGTMNGSSSASSQPQLDDFRHTRSHSSLTLHDVVQRSSLMELAMDQHGSRFIQQRLEIADDKERQAAFDSILPEADLEAMMAATTIAASATTDGSAMQSPPIPASVRAYIDMCTHQYGNYSLQRFVDLCNKKQRRLFCLGVRGHVLSLSMQMYGCRVIQKLLESTRDDPVTQSALVAELDGHVMDCVRDQNANHVIQKSIEVIHPWTRIAFIVDVFKTQIYQLSIHPYGCRVVQRLLEQASTNNIQEASAASASTVPSSSSSDSAASSSSPSSSSSSSLSSSLSSSSPPDCRAYILREIIDNVDELCKDQYGNYVVQHILQHGSKAHRKIIMDVITGANVTPTSEGVAIAVVPASSSPSSSLSSSPAISSTAAPSSSLSSPPSPVILGLSKVLLMARHKFASNVVEKCYTHAGTDERMLLIDQIIGRADEGTYGNGTNGNMVPSSSNQSSLTYTSSSTSPFLSMVKDQYANYVIQKMLDSSSDVERRAIVHRISRHSAMLRKIPFGKHIIAKIEKLTGTMG